MVSLCWFDHRQSAKPVDIFPSSDAVVLHGEPPKLSILTNSFCPGGGTASRRSAVTCAVSTAAAGPSAGSGAASEAAELAAAATVPPPPPSLLSELQLVESSVSNKMFKLDTPPSFQY